MVDSSAEDHPFPLTDTDRYVLSLTDEEYKYHDWEELKHVIATNNLSILKRKPSELRRYMAWTASTKAAYGNLTNFLLAHRLPASWGRPPFTPASEVPFADPADFHVLRNDWPYGLTAGITHIVVWTRTTIPIDPETGDVTPESRRLIQEFIDGFFVRSLDHGGKYEGEGGETRTEGGSGKERVLWFKNWAALQSVRALEHVHVLVRDVDEAVIDEWTCEREWHREAGPRADRRKEVEG